MVQRREERWWLVGENEKLGSGWGFFTNRRTKKKGGLGLTLLLGKKKAKKEDKGGGVKALLLGKEKRKRKKNGQKRHSL